MGRPANEHFQTTVEKGYQVHRNSTFSSTSMNLHVPHSLNFF